jgi:serine/threonine protein kinase
MTLIRATLSPDQRHDADIVLAVLQMMSPELGATDWAVLAEWWESTATANESLMHFLIRHEILSLSSAPIIEEVRAGIIPANEADGIFTVNGRGRLEQSIRQRQQAPESATTREHDSTLQEVIPASSNTPLPSNTQRILPKRPMPKVGDTLGKCRLVQKLGEGAAGIVFRATHLSLETSVAVKILRLGGDDATQAQKKRSLKAEAKLLARVSHPNIVRVLDFDDDEDYPYIVMEYVDGPTLGDLIDEDGRFAPLRAIDIVCQVTHGLAAANKLGIVHRDVKPANVLMTSDKTAKLADLGLASIAANANASASLAEVPEVWGGTVSYMPLEQFLGNPLDHRSDIYALGVCFYQMLTGKLPYQAETAVEMMFQHAESQVTPAHREVPGLPVAVSAVVARMMAKTPEQRYATYDELLAELGRLAVMLGEPLPPPRLSGRSSPIMLVPTGDGVPLPPAVGDVLGRCELVEELGNSPTRITFRAVHQALDTPVTVRVLKITHPDQIKDFKAQAKVLAKLNHPNATKVLDFADDIGYPYLILEYVDGQPLQALFEQRGKIPPRRSVEVIAAAAQGLAAALKLGIPHRSLSAANLLVLPDGSVKVADLGLATMLGAALNNQPIGEDVVGYLAPEQLNRARCDHRVDIYALGVCLYRAVTGKLPYTATSPRELLFQHLERKPALAHEVMPGLPVTLSSVLAKMLARNPDERIPNYDVLQSELARVSEALAVKGGSGMFSWLGLMRRPSSRGDE